MLIITILQSTHYTISRNLARPSNVWAPFAICTFSLLSQSSIAWEIHLSISIRNTFLKVLQYGLPRSSYFLEVQWSQGNNCWYWPQCGTVNGWRGFSAVARVWEREVMMNPFPFCRFCKCLCSWIPLISLCNSLIVSLILYSLAERDFLPN